MIGYWEIYRYHGRANSICPYRNGCCDERPDGKYTKEEVRKCVEYALVGRRRVKEQMKKIGGMEQTLKRPFRFGEEAVTKLCKFNYL